MPATSPDDIIDLLSRIRERANQYICDQLARRIGRKKNTVTGLVDTLQERGYCRRRPSPQDARVQLVSLSDRGEALRHVQTDISTALHSKLWQDIPPADQATCMAVLDSLLRNLAR